jgi:hypothetical protein
MQGLLNIWRNLNARYIVFPENLIVADIFAKFIMLMFKYRVHTSLLVHPILSQFSPVHPFIPLFSDMYRHQGILCDCSLISGPQNVAGPSFTHCHVFGCAWLVDGVGIDELIYCTLIQFSLPFQETPSILILAKSHCD